MKLLRMLFVFIMLAVILAFGGCAVASPLEDFNWVLIQYGQPGDVNPPLPDTQITLVFHSGDKTLSGNAGCNLYGGTYEADGLSLKITDLYQTEMYCGEAKDTQEKAYLNILKKADSFELERGNLIIHSGIQQLTFKRVDMELDTTNYWQK